MNQDRLNELLARCETPIERELLRNLYPHLTMDRTRELCAQYMIDCFDDMDLTIPDFAFPDMQIAIYCDGYRWHSDRVSFEKDRLQQRELQLRGWIVLRFAGSEINRDGEMVVDTVQRAIAKQQSTEVSSMSDPTGYFDDLYEKEHPIPTWQTRQDHQRPQKSKGGMCGLIALAFVIVGILVLLDFIF